MNLAVTGSTPVPLSRWYNLPGEVCVENTTTMKARGRWAMVRSATVGSLPMLLSDVGAADGRRSQKLESNVAAPKNALPCVDTVVFGRRWETADVRSPEECHTDPHQRSRRSHQKPTTLTTETSRRVPQCDRPAFRHPTALEKRGSSETFGGPETGHGHRGHRHRASAAGR